MSNRLSVLHVMECTIAGTRRHIVDLARGQQRAGAQVELAVSIEREPAFAADVAALREEGVRVHVVPMVRSLRPGKDARHLRTLTRLLEERRPRIVHTHSSKGGVLGRLASIQTGIGARVHTPHTFAFLFRAMFGAVPRALFRALEAGLGEQTARVIAVSHGEARTFEESGVVRPASIRVVPNGIDPARWEKAAAVERSELGVPEGAPMTAVIGLLNRAKGQDLAIEALTCPGLEDLHVLVVGRGETQVQLAAQAQRLGVAERTHILGWRDDVPNLLAACDFLLLPSRWEGMPYIVLEAMASGLPVVATRVDGASELVDEGRTGWLAQLSDAEHAGLERTAGAPFEIADCLVDAVRAGPQTRRTMGRMAAASVQGEFGLERMVERTLGVYRELL